MTTEKTQLNLENEELLKKVEWLETQLRVIRGDEQHLRKSLNAIDAIVEHALNCNY